MNIFSAVATSALSALSLLSPAPQARSLPRVAYTPPHTKPAQSFAETISVPQARGVVLGAEAPPTQTLTPIPRKLSKTSYTIAILGDSMVDTLGIDLLDLQNDLKKRFPNVSFRLLNYGVGATNIDMGLPRLSGEYVYEGRTVPSLISQNPDIVVIESFGYNPYSFSEGAIDRHWLALAGMKDAIRERLPKTKIVIAATIAPDRDTFGDGAPGVSFDETAKRERTDVIKEYLLSTVRFARGEGLPLADAFHPSLDGSGDGKIEYINPGDHIHYSDSGRKLFSQVLGEAIETNRLLE
ncbi:MAG: SGNH/GDSL hydrolase family protein [bacterium]|nr:SGNH/GDSL hydrolase family protein [bacterium]